MRKAKYITVALGLMACVSLVLAGEVDRVKLSVTSSATDATAAVTNTSTKIRGRILEVMVDLGTATTGDVTVAVSPELSTMSNINLFDADDVVADTVKRPHFPVHNAAGSATNTVVPYVCIGESVSLIVENFDTTSVVVNAVIKYEKR